MAKYEVTRNRTYREYDCPPCPPCKCHGSTTEADEGFGPLGNILCLLLLPITGPLFLLLWLYDQITMASSK